MKKKKYFLIISVVLTFIFIYFNFFFSGPKISLLNNTSKCLLSYNVKSIDIECVSFDEFYHFYLENNKKLLLKKIKLFFLDNKIKIQIFYI
jgi:hypothetical protein